MREAMSCALLPSRSCKACYTKTTKSQKNVWSRKAQCGELWTSRSPRDCSPKQRDVQGMAFLCASLWFSRLHTRYKNRQQGTRCLLLPSIQPVYRNTKISGWNTDEERFRKPRTEGTIIFLALPPSSKLAEYHAMRSTAFQLFPKRATAYHMVLSRSAVIVRNIEEEEGCVSLGLSLELLGSKTSNPYQMVFSRPPPSLETEIWR
jgi:hypothetical protein